MYLFGGQMSIWNLSKGIEVVVMFLSRGKGVT